MSPLIACLRGWKVTLGAYVWLIPHICHLFYTSRIFENQILHPKKTTKDTKNTKNVSEKVECMQFFFNSIWKNLHLTGNFYTGTACGACDKYEVWSHLRKSYLGGLSEVALPEVHQVSESPTLLIMFYLYFHSLIWALVAICWQKLNCLFVRMVSRQVQS